ncbi:MAG: hypothetical protein LBB89_03305 [Treponema sp.]|jgi:hypothetical protein|nr:hypothetical protein [Treponema sp.]
MAGFEADIKKEEFLMKKPVLVALIIALVCGMAMIGCSSDDGGSSGGGGGGFGLPSLPATKVATDLPDTEEVAFTSETNAKNAFEGAIGALLTAIGSANSDVFEAAFEDKYKTELLTSYAAITVFNITKADVSYDVTLDDDDDVLSAALIDDEEDPKATLTGKSSGSWKGSKTGTEFLAIDLSTDGALAFNQNTSYSMDKTISFGVADDATFAYASSTYTVAGYITVTASGQGSSAVDKKSATGEAAKYKTSGNGLRTVAIALSISDGTNSAKFIYSAADKTEGGARSADGLSGSNYGDLVVYNGQGDDKNKVKFTIRGYNGATLLTDLVNTLGDSPISNGF